MLSLSRATGSVLPHTAGFVLVGGRSSRMGCDKARLDYRSRPLVSNIADQVSAVVRSVALVGRPDAYRDLGYECLDDMRPGHGPLSGIHAALISERGQYNLVVACDMPALSPDLLSTLLQTAHRTCARCTAAVDSDGRLHPLCAVYHRSALPAIENAIAASRLCLLDLLAELDVHTVKSFCAIPNCNTPAEWHLTVQGIA